MKKVALFMDGWKRYFTYAWPLGFMQKIKEARADVNLYIFNSNGNWNRDDGYSYGEYNIYNLPELTDFDGIIISVNNIKYPEVTAELLDRIRKSGVPAISLETAFDGLHFVGIDNYDAMYDMTRHMIEKHGAKKVWYLAGPKDNYEARERCRAFRDCMDEYGLPVDDEDVLFGDFSFNDGVTGFEELLRAHGHTCIKHEKDGPDYGGPAEVYGEITSGSFADSAPNAEASNNDEMNDRRLEEREIVKKILPDAIICANDNLAVGVCNRAEALGLSVPKDFKVTGFDNFDKAAYYTPRITTVSRIREKIGAAAAEIMLNIWAGNNPDTSSYIDYNCIFTESCGCGADAMLNGRQYLKNYIMGVVEREEIDESTLDFTHLLSKCGDYSGLYPCVQTAYSQAGCKKCVMVVDRSLVEMGGAGPTLSAAYDEDVFAVKGYPQRMQIVYKQGVADDGDDTYHSMFPLLDDEAGGNIFLFAPFHFGEKAVGFCCVENGYYLMDKQLWSTVMSEVNVAMINLFNKWRLEQINQELTAISIKDPLTQIYNREGMRQIAAKAFDKAADQGRALLIMFADMDRLKYINDTYGHEFGDKAIRNAARAVAGGGGISSIPVRYGGDEFVSISIYDEDETPEERKTAILEKAREIVAQEKLPFELEFSIGYVITDPDGDKTLEEYVREADHSMYQEKMQRRVSRQ